MLKFSNPHVVLIVVQIPVKSLSDFYELYLGSSSRKQGQKIANESPHRSHRGLIVHISSTNDAASDARSVAKMNFVDMAGIVKFMRPVKEL